MHGLCLTNRDEESPKRIVFAGVQNKQTTHILHATALPVRTGYERVIGRRVDDMYAAYAKEDGEVVSITDKVITVKYKSGEMASYEIGRRFGNWAGATIPHDLVTDLEVGGKLKKDAVIAYNKHFFVRDTLDPSQIIQTNSTLVRAVLVETPDTLEDSGAISPELGQRIATTTTEPRVIKLDFSQEVRGLLSVGDEVEFDSILCTIENKTASRADIFDEKSLDTLRLISSLTPKAKCYGIIEKIEVFYAGEPEDMSESIRALAEASDRQLVKFRKQLGKKAVSGQVEPGFRIQGMPLDNDTAIIRVYITGEMPAGVGDKFVVGHQLKGTIASVMPGICETESGLPIDLHFSYQSVLNRIVNSPMFMGTTAALLVRASEEVVKAYED